MQEKPEEKKFLAFSFERERVREREKERAFIKREISPPGGNETDETEYLALAGLLSLGPKDEVLIKSDILCRTRM